MDVVKDEDAEEGNEEEDEEVEAKEGPRTPVKLLGRGGFSHPRGGRRPNRGRGRGGGDASSRPPAAAELATQTAPAKTVAADPMDGLASSMSALQFVPHSLYARGRGRGRGG